MSGKSFDTANQLAAIRYAQENLYDFCRWMFLQRKGYLWMRAGHHQAICDALMRVYRGECKRLIINIPPRYSKTEIAVVNFMAWALGKCPDAEFIHTSYSSRLASNNAWQTREIVVSEEYRRIFPGTTLRQDSSAKDEWRTTAGGCVYAVGAGGTITGYGAGKHREGFGGAIVIDDPHKADEARSDVMRQNVIDWFQNTLESRCNSPDTPIILIMQRLHEKDLAGWLLGRNPGDPPCEGGNGEVWEHLCLEALRPDGSALWPEKHTPAKLQIMQRVAPYTFSGQYQQQPSPAEGHIFKPNKIEVIDAIPSGCRFVRAWDLAASREKQGTDPDYTVGAKIGQLQDGRLVIIDIDRFRGAPHEVEAALKNDAKRDGTNCRVRIPQDPGQAGKAQVAYLIRQLAGFTVVAEVVSGDKVKRAEPFASQVNVGNVMMLRAGWNDTLIDEMRMFPNGSHDDQIDALSDAFAELNDNSFGMLDFMAAQAEKQQKEQEHQRS